MDMIISSQAYRRECYKVDRKVQRLTGENISINNPDTSAAQLNKVDDIV